MKFKMFLLVWTIFWLSTVQHAMASNEALLECGRVLNIENITNLSSASGSYSNNRCMLVCVIGSGILPVSSIHEGRSCPEDTNGICRAGQCISGQEDALRECGLKHGVDFHKVGNYQGTAYTNDQCGLRCVIGGIELPVSHLHEGSPCLANSINGLCRSGTCLVQSTNAVSTVTPPLTTITPKPPTSPIPPTTVTQPTLDSFSPSKMRLLNISLESTDPTPLHHMLILNLGFYVTSNLAQSNRIVICTFYGDSRHPNYYNLQNIHNIASKLTKSSLIGIELNQLNTWLTTTRHDLYPVFDTFYKNRKLDFGKEEHFVATFPIYSMSSSHPKVMDISLRFTIVFSKD